jgi:hypothetical protein
VQRPGAPDHILVTDPAAEAVQQVRGGGGGLRGPVGEVVGGSICGWHSGFKPYADMASERVSPYVNNTAAAYELGGRVQTLRSSWRRSA